jgi:hypothetical protein
MQQQDFGPKEVVVGGCRVRMSSSPSIIAATLSSLAPHRCIPSPAAASAPTQGSMALAGKLALVTGASSGACADRWLRSHSHIGGLRASHPLPGHAISGHCH